LTKAPTIDAIAASLTVPERVLLFCLASGTDWVKAGVPHSTVQHLLIRNLVERDYATMTARGEHLAPAFASTTPRATARRWRACCRGSWGRSGL